MIGRVKYGWAGLLLAACGCALHVDQEKEVAKYRKIVDGTPAVSFVPGQPLSLEQAMALANQHNERIALQGENYLQALIAKDRAAAAFLPTISLAPSYFEQQNPGGNASAGTEAGRNAQTDVPVTGTWNLFRGMSDVANVQAAARTIEQRRALLLDAQAIVLIDVAQTYYDVLRAERSVVVLVNTLAVQEARVREARIRQKAGFVPPLDVAQTEAQAASTRTLLIIARNNAANGRAVLGFLIGVNVNGSPLVDAAQAPANIALIKEFQEMAQRQRQDLVAAQRAIEAAKYDVNAAIGQYFPSVTLSANAFLSRESPPSESEWNYLLSVNVPIFTGGIIEADVRRAWSLWRQAALSERALRRQVLQEVEVAYGNLQTSQQRYRELQVQLGAAEEALRLAEVSYRVAGLAKNLDVLAAQDAVLSAQLQLASEQYNQKVFYLVLLRAAGALSTTLPGEARAAPSTQPTTMPATAPARQRS